MATEAVTAGVSAGLGIAQQGLDLANSINATVQTQKAHAAEMNQQNEDENNIRCAFVDNTLAELGKVAPNHGYLIVQDTRADDDSKLEGRVLPLDNAEVAIGQARTATYRVYVFTKGEYTHNQGFGKGYWGYMGNVKRDDSWVHHGLHKDPKAILTFS